MTPGTIGRLARRAAAALGVAVALVVVTHPLWLAPVVSRWLSSTSGRDVRFGSIRLGLRGDLRPVVRFVGVRIANTAWADPGWPFADVGEAVMTLSWRSLFERLRIVDSLVLRDARIDLERQADGLRNWRLSDPEDRGPGRYRVRSLQAERSTIRFSHRGVDLVLEATSQPSTGDPRNRQGDALPLQLGFRGEWRGQPFTAEVASASTLTFVQTGRSFALRGTLLAGDLQLDLDGRAGDLFRHPLFDADVARAGATLAPVRAVYGAGDVPRGVGKRSWKVAAHAVADASGGRLDALRVALGESDAAGHPAWQLGDHDRLRAELAADLLDVADVEWLAASFAGAGAVREARVAPRPEVAASASASGAREATLVVDAKRLRWARLPQLGRAHVEATVGTGAPSKVTFEVGVARGVARGGIVVNRDADPQTAEVELSAHGVRLESLLPTQAEKKRITGVIDARARLASTRGDGGWLAGLAGSVDATLTDGSIGSLLDAELGLQAFRMLRAWIGGASVLPLRCARVGVDLRDGRGHLRGLVVDTAETVTRGSGSIDLRAKTFDLTLTADAKDGGVLALDRSIHLHGPFGKPERELVPRKEQAKANCAG